MNFPRAKRFDTEVDVICWVVVVSDLTTEPIVNQEYLHYQPTYHVHVNVSGWSTEMILFLSFFLLLPFLHYCSFP